ncbi:hypothetical protein [uncultured Muribaculum sp.]|uniref:hypothetical protein n=1 Tax=uncultured Muribaculum sp. TaxID=1918613 RepID=UPI0025953CD5|nr:hypothetical protein [uncultured Muribaculum sp.]
MRAMNTEDIENKWSRLDLNLNKLDDKDRKTMDALKLNNLKSAQQRLADTYRRFSIVAILLVPTLILGQLRFLDWKLLLGFAVYFLIASGMDFYLYRGIKGLDLNEMGVDAVAEKARHYKKVHHCCQIVLISMCVPLLAGMFMSQTEEYFRWGMLCGLVIGVAIGLSLYIKMMRNYKDMIK